MSNLNDAVTALVASYGDIRAEARTYQFTKSEIDDALSKVDADSAEGVVLRLLSYNAIETPTKAKKSADPVDQEV